MGILSWIVFGILAGSVAKLAMPGPAAGGMAVAIPVGVAGALVGGILAAIFSRGALIDFEPYSLLMAVSGALLALLCYRSYALRLVA